MVVLHEVFMLLGAQTGCVITGMSAPAGGLMGHGAPAVPPSGCAIAMAHTGMGKPSLFAATAIIGAHVAATAVMVALLAYGEKVLWLRAGWVCPPRSSRVGLPELLAVRVMSSGGSPKLRVRFAFGGVGRRGPPPRGPFVIV